MTTEYSWPVSGYKIVFTKGFGPKNEGWIELYHGTKIAGYLLFDYNGKDHGWFGAETTPHPYIAIPVSPDRWSFFIDILRNEKPLYITGRKEDGSDEVSCFFGSTKEPVGEGE